MMRTCLQDAHNPARFEFGQALSAVTFPSLECGSGAAALAPRIWRGAPPQPSPDGVHGGSFAAALHDVDACLDPALFYSEI